MEAGKTGKYFKYAIGEIVLVMIGILLALQVNNWNENRKQLANQNAIYLIVKQDLQTDILEFESFIKTYKAVKLPAFKAVLSNHLTREDWQKNPSYSEVISGYKDLAISQLGVNLLKGASSISNNLEQELNSEINKFYNKHIVEVNMSIKEIGNQFERNNFYFQNFGWYAPYLLDGQTDGFIESFYNDPTLKSRIAVYYYIFEIYVVELYNYMTNAEILIADIDNYLKAN